MPLMRDQVYEVIRRHFAGGTDVAAAGEAADEIVELLNGAAGSSISTDPAKPKRLPKFVPRNPVGTIFFGLDQDELGRRMLAMESFTHKSLRDLGYEYKVVDAAIGRFRSRKWIDKTQRGRETIWRPTQTGLDAKLEYDTRPPVAIATVEVREPAET